MGILSSLASGAVGGIVKPLADLAGGWLTRRHELTMAKHQAKVEWASTMATSSMTSWKDEYLTVVWTAPFVCAIFGYNEPLNNLIAAWNQIPNAYAYILSAITLASFGISVSDGFDKILAKRRVRLNGHGNGNGNSNGTAKRIPKADDAPGFIDPALASG